MIFKEPLLEGNLLKRYKRFFADVEYNDEKFTIHVPNTGSLKNVILNNPDQPQRCWFSLHHDESKKLKGTLEAVQVNSSQWVGINTANPNKIVNEAIQNSFKEKTPFFQHWKKYSHYKPEFKISKESRLDGVFVKNIKDLEDPHASKHFIEIKNTTYKDLDPKIKTAQFPDSVTERGQKHIEEMIKLMKLGHACEMIFTVQRQDVTHFSPCSDIDPRYADLLKKAYDLGLIITPVIVEFDQTQIKLSDRLLKLDFTFK